MTPPPAGAVVEVVDPDTPTRVVGYGETGRVRLTTLTKEFFMPRFLERDEAEREAPCDAYPWDGVPCVVAVSRSHLDGRTEAFIAERRIDSLLALVAGLQGIPCWS